MDRRNTPLPGHPERAVRHERVEVVTIPFEAADDSAITWAIYRFEEMGKSALLVVHPDPHGITAVELTELRARFAHRLRGRYAVFARHPDDPLPRFAPRTRVGPSPTLHFVRTAPLSGAG